MSIIDLGFNSVKLVNYDVKNATSYKSYFQQGIKVKTGEGLHISGKISKKAAKRTIEALKLFHDIVNFESIKHVIPIATSAVREAKNRQDFLKETYKETGFQFKVLSCEEEALYSYAGALKSTCVPTSLYFDLGGGSLELVYAENFKIKKVISLPIGSLRLSQKYLNSSSPASMTFTKKNYQRMKQYIMGNMPDREALDLSPDTELIGAGGTLRALTRYNQEITRYSLYKIHNYHLDYSSVDSISRRFSKMTAYELAKIEPIGKDRAETITAGSCAIHMLMRKLAFDKIIVCSQALREGVLSSFLKSLYLFRSRMFDQNQIQDLVRTKCGREKLPNSSRNFIVPLLSSRLIREREYEIIALAMKQLSSLPSTTNLHNLFYIIIDEDNRYLSHSEQLVLALSIVHMRKEKIADWLFTRYKSILQPQNRNSIEKIAACISVSNIIEGSKCKVNIKSLSKKKITLEILTPETNTPLPQILLRESFKKFENAFDITTNYSISYTAATTDSSKDDVDDKDDYDNNTVIPFARIREEDKIQV